MRVGFNAQLLSYRAWYRSAGISRYIDRTLTGLRSYLAPNNVVVFVGPDVPTESPVLAPFLQRRTNLPTARPIVRILWEQLALPLALARMRLDLLHSPAYVVPLVGKVPAVVTFHDLSFFVMPSAFNRQNRLYLQAMARQSARHAARFIAVSQATRRDLVRILGVREDQVDVVYNGVDDTFQPIADEARLDGFRAQYDLPRRFILYLGTLEPRKNVAALVRAYAVARQRGVTEPLILAGGRGWGDLALGQLIAELDLQDVVRMVGFVEMSDQALWYNAATLFVYPSLYEGFGFPVLEAMACGTPVLASDRSSLPEVVGDAGLVVDPMNPDSLAESMVTLLGDDDLRVRFRALGLERARTFRWDAAARQTVESYHRALSAS